MKEKEFINLIKKTLKSEYIGDDCAYLKDLGIVVSQDNLVENIHFSLDFTTPYKLGWKAAMVNISDICASGAEPLYLTVGLSLPADVQSDFVEEFYKGLKDAAEGVKIVGGDITGANKMFISITAIGKTSGRKISSRKNAKIGQKIIVSGAHGSSGAGLKLLMSGKHEPVKFINSHLMPEAQIGFSKKIARSIKEDYAMMDTSDGLADALFKIAESSGVCIIAKEVDGIFGAEDYKLVAAVPADFLQELADCEIIGDVIPKQDYILKIGENEYKNYDELVNLIERNAQLDREAVRVFLHKNSWRNYVKSIVNEL